MMIPDRNPDETGELLGRRSEMRKVQGRGNFGYYTRAKASVENERMPG